MIALKILSVLLVVLLLAACGGGGGGGPPVERIYDDGPGPDERVGEAASFVHRATLDNTLDNRTYVDHAFCNGDPEAILLVTQLYVPAPHGGFGVYNGRNIAVRYDAFQEQWAILNANLDNLPVGARFNVTAATGNVVGATTFLSYVSTAENSNEDYLNLDHPLLNDNPSARIFLTQNVSANGESLRRNQHVASVTYRHGRGQWAITHAAGGAARLFEEMGYNICIPATGAGNHFHEVGTHWTNPGNSAGPVTTLNLFGSGTAIAHATPVLDTGEGGASGGFSDPYAVTFDTGDGRWDILDESGVRPMPMAAAFFVGSARP